MLELDTLRTRRPLQLGGRFDGADEYDSQAGEGAALKPSSAKKSVPLLNALQVLDGPHNDVTDQFFRRSGGQIELARSVIPAMFTSDREVVRQDCLCYFMEPL